MNPIESARLQDAIVSRLLSIAVSGWERIVLNVELLEDADGSHENFIAFSVHRQGSSLVANDFELANDVLALFWRYRESLSTAGSPWGSCTCTVFKSGRYRFDLSYDPPPRLSGVLTDESLFANYLDRYDDAEQ